MHRTKKRQTLMAAMLCSIASVGHADVSAGERVLIIAPSASPVYVGHAEGELIEVQANRATVAIDSLDIPAWNESQHGRRLHDEHEAGDTVTVPLRHVEPYQAERVDLIEDRAAMNRWLEPKNGSPALQESIEDQQRYLDHLRRQLGKRDRTLDEMPVIAAEIAMRERYIEHTRAEYPDLSPREPMPVTPGLWPRITFEVLEEYGLLADTRELFLADKIRHPFADRQNDRIMNLWHQDPDAERDGEAYVPVTLPGHTALAMPLFELIEYDDAAREIAAMMVDHFDGAHQEGSREEQIEALIDVAAGL